MTKQQQTLAWGIGAGVGIAALLYMVLRRQHVIPEIAPTAISWAGNG